ncbi:MAG: hypothetical protein F6K47_42480 [Symploca sp. SIO2E6]|nr:hypothetical protein [Symploca sp. SIO2E6]
MKNSLSLITLAELRQYLSANRHNEEAFSQALEELILRKKYSFKYPPPSERDYKEIESMLEAKLNHN